jgi:hypothetical protein
VSEPPGKVFAVKVALAVSGLAVALFGMATDRSWVVWVAVAILAAAFLLRFLRAPPPA